MSIFATNSVNEVTNTCLYSNYFVLHVLRCYVIRECAPCGFLRGRGLLAFVQAATTHRGTSAAMGGRWTHKYLIIKLSEC